ncbi:MAG: Sulfopyruvate decarboxylase subunit beta [Promethearchaeota archaeon]|nr:MAG: Sulfopyruvate decarboxylase subunit beta [Candidatus Lokiarchaeota archaeon]
MKRFEILKEISKTLSDEIIVCNIGIPSRELYTIKDRDKNFYMLGSMGLASSIALGLAIAKPNEKIICIDGDGALLMNLGSLSTIANVNPPNLTHIVIDNGAYGSTGSQTTYTKKKTNLLKIAEGAGFKSFKRIRRADGISSTLKNLEKGCHFILIEAKAGNKEVGIIPYDAVEIKKRFMNALNKN